MDKLIIKKASNYRALYFNGKELIRTTQFGSGKIDLAFKVATSILKSKKIAFEAKEEYETPTGSGPGRPTARSK